MGSSDLLPLSVLRRKAIVYVRQSTPGQVQENHESRRRQYDLAETARRHGFSDVEIIDDDLGRSASGAVERPGFERLVAQLCAGTIGAVLCLEASRLARNGRDWHHLLELCGLVEARVIDLDGIYNPCLPNDRLLLGMKGSISEFELGLLRARLVDAARSKARRGELRIPVPTGYSWHREAGLGFDPDLRLQEVIRLIFRKFRELGSARQVLLWMHKEEIHFPRPSDGKQMVSFEWQQPRYRSVISVLTNPFYAGAYAYGKSEKRTELIGGRACRSYGHRKPLEEWETLLKNHHEGYISWEDYERNQEQLTRNAFGKAGGTKSGRGGRALLAGLLSCARCGRHLNVVYTGRAPGAPKYRCDRPNLMLGMSRCMAFSSWRVDQAIVDETIQAVAPMAIEAAMEAERMHEEKQVERRRMMQLELEQARYEASLAERRYAACDPDNRLIAAQLEKGWEAALRRVQACKERLEVVSESSAVPTTSFVGLANDLEAAWNAPGTTMRTRQRLVRALIEDIVVDVDGNAGEIILVIHWKGGQHSEVRTRKPQTGEHRCRAPAEVLAIVQSMAGRWPDDQIAASLNRMGLQTGQGNTWNDRRVRSLRETHEIHAYRSAEKDGQWLTLTEAADDLGVTSHTIRRLIKDGDLPAIQVVAGAPHQIKASDLRNDRVKAALDRRGCPRHRVADSQLSMFSNA
ncbi:MAG: recombinase family protein [Hyphomicrobium sp.]